MYCGVDVGKSEHHACALDPAGKRLYDKALPNDEAALVRVLTELAGHGRVLVVVDQPAAIGALVIAVARALGIDVAYLPGLAMRRIADLYPGEGKTDARDAENLYRLLEEEVIPLYYDRDIDGLPQQWIKRMMNSISSLAWRFSADRMVADYVRAAYLPAAGGLSCEMDVR